MSGEGRRSLPKKAPLPFKAQQERKEVLVMNHVCSYTRELVQRLQSLETVEDACSLMGLITVYGKQLRERNEFFRTLLLDIYKLLEDTVKDQFRVVLLHLIELITSKGNLDPSTNAYYKRKALLPKSCEDAFNGALNFGEEIVLKLESPLCSPQIQMICPNFPEGGDSNCLVNAVEEKSHLSSVPSPTRSCQETLFIKQEVNNNTVVDDDNLAEEFGECVQSALSKVSSVSKQPEEFVMAEEEKGTKHEAQSQILPSSTAFEVQPSFFEDCSIITSISETSTGSDRNAEIGKDQWLSMKMPVPVNLPPKDDYARTNVKVFEKTLTVKGDVTVLLSSHSELHLEEVCDFLKCHFVSSESLDNDNQSVVGSASHTTSNRELVTYSREFLLQCSTQSQSKLPPRDCVEISGKYPEIWCPWKEAFSPASYTPTRVRSLVRHESTNIHSSDFFRRTMSLPNPDRSHSMTEKSPEPSEDSAVVIIE